MGVCVHPPMLVMELLPRGSVHDVIHHKKTELHWSIVFKFALDAAKGMTRLHSESILHRDLKSKNLMVDQNWTVKVSDFGLSGLKSSWLSNEARENGKLGTLPWTAPEVFEDQPHTEKSDVYSYGIILYELLSRKVPWKDRVTESIPHAVVIENKRPRLAVDIPRELEYMEKMMRRCWHRNTGQR